MKTKKKKDFGALGMLLPAAFAIAMAIYGEPSEGLWWLVVFGMIGLSLLGLSVWWVCRINIELLKG